MNVMEVIIGIVLVIVALIMIVTVLLQESKSAGLGSISGGAETFFGKNKGQSMEGKLELITKISAAVFVVLSLVMLIIS